MKAKIKVKRMSVWCDMPKIADNGDWIDLRAAETTIVSGKPAVTIIPLGVAIQLPAGYEAIICSRSSTPSKQHIWNASALGIIDNSYCGDKDEWKWTATPIGKEQTIVHTGQRVCQFRIQLSQKATTWQKIKWLFTSGVEIVEVDHLGNEDRDGLGTSGVF